MAIFVLSLQLVVAILLIVTATASSSSSSSSFDSSFTKNNQDVSKEWKTLYKKTLPIDLKEVRNKVKQNKIDGIDASEMHIGSSTEFTHMPYIIDAIKNKRGRFNIYESSHEPIKEADSRNTTALASVAFHNTTTTYELFDTEKVQYVNFDTIDNEAITDFQEDRIVLSSKHAAGSKEIKENDFIVGSHIGSWVKSKHVLAAAAAVSMKSQDSLATTHILARRVVSIRHDDATGHMHVETESVLPLELFKKVRIESIGEHPVQESYTPLSESEARKILEETMDGDIAKKDRELGTEYVPKPDLPVVECSQANFGTGYTIAGDDNNNNNNYDYTYMLGAYIGCAQYKYQFPGSFNFNYDFLNKRASTSLNIGNYVSCSNCYIYMGAGFLAIFEYTTSWYPGPFGGTEFYIEAKIGGSAGFGLDVTVNAPVLSSTTEQTLLYSDKKYSTINLGNTGLYLGYKLGGLTATLSGSGSATGSINFGAALDASAEIGIMYADSSVTFPSTSQFSYTPPYFTNNNFDPSALAATLSLEATENFELSFAFAWVTYISATFDASVETSTNIDFGTSNFRSSVFVNKKKGNKVNKSAKHNVQSYDAGDVVTVTFDYDHFNPNEDTELYYSLVLQSGSIIPIMQESIKTTSSGKGSHTADWVIPWNTQFAQASADGSTVYIQVKSSNLLTKAIVSDAFQLDVFTDSDTIFITGPSDDEVVKTDKEFSVKWNPDLLTVFISKVSGEAKIGSLVPAVDVNFELVGEVIVDNAVTMTIMCGKLMNYSIPNSGETNIIVSSNYTSVADRFYLTVSDSTYGNVKGWSSGYFKLSKKGKVSQTASLREQVQVAPSKKADALRSEILKLKSRTESLPVTPQSIETQATCSDGSMGYGSRASGAFTGIKSVLGSYPVSSPTAAVTLLTPTPSCVSLPTPVASPVVSPITSPVASPVVSPISSPVASPVKKKKKKKKNSSGKD